MNSRLTMVPCPAPVTLGLLALVLSVLSPHANAQGKSLNTLRGRDRAIYDSLKKTTVDPRRCFAVRPHSVWTTDLGTYRFESGVLAFFTTVDGRPTGCLFQGRGHLEFRPPSANERAQLRRFTGDTLLRAETKEVYFRFVDSLVIAGLRDCADTLRVDPPGHERRLRRYEKDVLNDISLDLPAVGWEHMTNTGPPPRWLYIRPRLAKHRRLHFLLDDTGTEATSLWRRPRGVSSKGIVDLVCSYDSPRSPEDSLRHAALINDGFDVEHYDSHVDISVTGKTKLAVTLTGTVRRPGLNVLEFNMAPHLTIQSISVDRQETPFIYHDRQGWLQVRSPRELHRGDTVVVRFEYSSTELLEKLARGSYYIRHTTQWLPKTAPRQRATYRTTFEYPRYYIVVSVGEQVSDSTVGDRRVSVWRTYGRESFISFNYGAFERLTERMDNGVRLDIYRAKNHRNGLFAGDFKKTVAADIKGSLELFSRMFGPYPWDHLAATEIPGNHGQGFPQLLHLARESFTENQKGVTDAFRAHEVAHQWFGHIVGWRSYHDQWLSEGFAEYAGALYVQSKYPGNREFFDLLKRWRKNILTRGGHDLWYDGPQVAPIWLGFRTSSFQSPGSYRNIIYAKAAYVVHMLRQMLYDYGRGNDFRFREMMHDYISRYAGRDVSTEDFRREVERFMHRPMKWFFDQWVYGTQIPRFEYRWERRQLADGRWIVHGQIDQFDTDPPFRVAMPITVVFKDGRKTRLLEVSKAHTEFDTPATTHKPQNVIFDDFYTVLCREKVVGKP